MDLKLLSKTLNDKDDSLMMANLIIDQLADNSNQDELTKELCRHWSKFIANENINHIFKYAQSPIEKIFLNSIHYFGLMFDSRICVFTPQGVSINESQEKYDLIKAKTNEIRAMIKEDFPNKSEEEIDVELFETVERITDKDFYDHIYSHHLMYEILGLKHSYHFTLQTFVEDVQVNQQRIRPDITIWMPEDKRFKLIVECDGYQFHSDKETFTKDRQKDRVLQKNDFEIHRYSGIEIYNKPLETAMDLCQYLFAKRKKLLET